MTAKRIMIFDDDEEFGENLVGAMERYGYEAKLIPSVTKLDTADTWNNYWDCIVSDVDFELGGSVADGHSIISSRIKDHHLNCPVIVMSGKRSVGLDGIKETYGDTFAAYLSKTNLEFESKLITEIEKAIFNTTKLALARFKVFFENEDKLGWVLDPEEIADETLGITPREGDTTIGMMIDDCTKMLTEEKDIDKIEIDSYILILWKLYEDFLSGRYDRQ